MTFSKIARLFLPSQESLGLRKFFYILLDSLLTEVISISTVKLLKGIVYIHFRFLTYISHFDGSYLRSCVAAIIVLERWIDFASVTGPIIGS